MLDLEHVPEFMIDRAITFLQGFRDDIDAEISRFRSEKNAREWRERRAGHMAKITADLVKTGMTDEMQSITWLCEQGHRPEYAHQILSAMRNRIEAEKKASREVEIFRRWIVVGDKKTALAREFGLSRATVERICRRLSENDGLKAVFNQTKKNSRTACNHAGASQGSGVETIILPPVPVAPG